MKKVILTCFAGRKDYMSIQVKYILKLLENYEFIERYDIWDFSWSKTDSEYLKSLTNLHPKIHLKKSPHYGEAKRASSIASKQFAFFFSDAYDVEEYKDHIFVKIDDDVLYVDFDNFENFIKIRDENQNYFLVSANVINNNINIKDPSTIHLKFLENFKEQKNFNKSNLINFGNSNRLSINFCSWLGKDLPLIKNEFSNGVGSNDEWRLCHIIPNRIGKSNLIVEDFIVSHFSFGVQSFDKEVFYKNYLKLCNTII